MDRIWMQSEKVFGIGFHKTGTTSLELALGKLGYSVTGPNLVHSRIPSAQLWGKLKDLIDKFDAFQDNPWPIFFKELYAYRPGSKFILTVRPTSEWIRSVVDFFGPESTPMRERIYGFGSPFGHELEYIERYERHNTDVLDFFSDKPASLLVMNLAAGDGWSKLCAFLGRLDVPSLPFPHAFRRHDSDHTKPKERHEPSGSAQ
jgi:hypothetical protein